MMTTAGVVTIGGVTTTVAGTVAGDILAGVITMDGGTLAGGTVGGTTNPRVLTFARVCQRSDVSLVPYSLASCLGVARRPSQGATAAQVKLGREYLMRRDPPCAIIIGWRRAPFVASWPTASVAGIWPARRLQRESPEMAPLRHADG